MNRIADLCVSLIYRGCTLERTLPHRPCGWIVLPRLGRILCRLVLPRWRTFLFELAEIDGSCQGFCDLRLSKYSVQLELFGIWLIGSIDGDVVLTLFASNLTEGHDLVALLC